MEQRENVCSRSVRRPLLSFLPFASSWMVAVAGTTTADTAVVAVLLTLALTLCPTSEGNASSKKQKKENGKLGFVIR